jgi:NADPH:quinone reductase-like Zn-dependent oxidoreductase
VFGYNDTKFGAHAEFMTVAETDAITTMPDDVTFEQAAPVTEGAHYALCDIRAAKIKSGHNVMIYGASGAIGSAAVQLVKYLGAEVTAVCNTQNVEAVKSLGADRVIDYMTQDFTKTGQKFDFIFDAVGKSSFGQCKPLLKEHGIYISTELGKNSENIFLALLTPVFKGKKVLFPLPSVTKEDVVFLKKLVESGKFKPLIDRSYHFNSIVDAYRYVETRQKVGNVVITLTYKYRPLTWTLRVSIITLCAANFHCFWFYAFTQTTSQERLNPNSCQYHRLCQIQTGNITFAAEAYKFNGI